MFSFTTKYIRSLNGTFIGQAGASLSTTFWHILHISMMKIQSSKDKMAQNTLVFHQTQRILPFSNNISLARY